MRSRRLPAKPGGPAALRVEERELAGDRSELTGEDVIEHPGLDGNAAACGLEDAQSACLLGEVDQGGGRDLPVPASRCRPWSDPVVMCVSCQRRDDARGIVEQCEERVAVFRGRQRLVGDDEHPAVPGGRKLTLEPCRLAGDDLPAGAAIAADKIEHDHPQSRSDVEHVVEASGHAPRLGPHAGASPQPPDHLCE